MTSPGNKALIEEAMRRVAELEQAGLSFLGSFERLATALEVCEAERERQAEALEVTRGQHQVLLKRAERFEAQLQQTQARLEEAARFLDALNSSRWPPGNSPVNDFLASLQDNKETKQ